MNIEYDKKMISCDLKFKLIANYGNSTATIINGEMSNYHVSLYKVYL